MRLRIRGKITLLVTLLIALVIGSIVANLIWVEQRRVRQEFAGRADALLEGVMRIGRESLAARDELMLLSYLKFLMNDYPEIESVIVSREGHTSLLGAVRSELSYRTLTITDKEAATFREAPSPAAAPSPAKKGSLPPATISIQMGFSKTALDAKVRGAQAALAAKILRIAGIGLLLGIAGSLWVARRLATPITALALAARDIGEGKLDTTVAVGEQDEIGDLSEQFNRMSQRLRELIRFKEDLLGTLSHELNNPLGGLEGFLQHLRDSDAAQDPADRQDSYQTMTEAVSQMKVSLSNALALFRSDAAPELRLEDVCLNEVFAEVVRLFAPTARSGQVELQAPAASPAVRLSGDKELLRRVAVNLVSNALKHTPPGGAIVIRLEEDERDAMLAVADTGAGIPRDCLDKIFTKFYRAPGPDGRPQRLPGSGLGLAISKQAVDLHRGRIWAESEPGRGSVFYVRLPKGGAYARA